MTSFTIAVLAGDGIGPEVTAEAIRVLKTTAELHGFGLHLAEYAIGAAGVDEAGDALPPRTRSGVLDADAVLLGALEESVHARQLVTVGGDEELAALLVWNTALIA